MIIEIDFNSEEALYLQLCNQIIMGIATSRFREGDPLPSVRQLADSIGINMHTVNKAYTVLKQEGYVKVDRDMATNLPGVFAAGDCTGGPLQLSKAIGEGLIAGQRAAAFS